MNINPHRSRAKSAFTLVEMLVVVLILAILMSVALPLYMSAVKDSQLKTCRANMQSIANAVQSARVRMASANYSQIIAHNRTRIDINPNNASLGALTDLPAVPYCTSGGTYQIRAADPAGDSFYVRCRRISHGTFEPGVPNSMDPPGGGG